jgi:hypothetical protein
MSETNMSETNMSDTPQSLPLTFGPETINKQKGEIVVFNELKWTVLDVYRTRVKRLRLKIAEFPPENQ